MSKGRCRLISVRLYSKAQARRIYCYGSLVARVMVSWRATYGGGGGGGQWYCGIKSSFRLCAGCSTTNNTTTPFLVICGIIRNLDRNARAKCSTRFHHRLNHLHSLCLKYKFPETPQASFVVIPRIWRSRTKTQRGVKYASPSIPYRSINLSKCISM